MRLPLTPIAVGVLAAVPILIPAVVDAAKLDESEISFLIRIVPYAFFALIGVLGFRLNQTRVLVASMCWIFSYWFLFEEQLPIAGAIPFDQRARMIAVALPASMIIAFCFSELPLFNWRGGLRAAATLLPPLVLLIVWAISPAAARRFTESSLLRDVFGSWRLPDVGLILAALFAAMIPMTRDQKMRPFVYCVAATLLPVGFGLNLLLAAKKSVAGHAGGQISASLGFSSAGLMLLYMLYRIYWERVYLDDLTQILNRRALDEKLNGLRTRYAIAMVDIDHFKKFNDTYGHDQGDHVLRLVATHLKREFGDCAYRYGGEEFCLLLNGGDPGALKSRLDTVRETLAEKQFYLRAPRPKKERGARKRRGKGGDPQKRVNVTASFGVAISANGKNAKDVITAADEALYTAKKRGRNRVVVAAE